MQTEPLRLDHGACLCGAVTVIAAGPPTGVAACHCASCRRHTGAPVAVFADYNRDQISFPAARATLYESTPGIRRGFCARCGSTISYQGDNRPNMIHLHVGIFDYPERFHPQAAENILEKLPWIHIETRP